MNKLPAAHKKANKARCDKRRNRQRKILKARTKLEMACLTDGCWYNGKNMKYMNPATLVWRLKRGNEKLLPKNYQKLTSSELAKRLSILSDKKFFYYFKQLGECICRNCLSEEQWQQQMIDYIEDDRQAA